MSGVPLPGQAGAGAGSGAPPCSGVTQEGRPFLNAVRTDTPPRIDGLLDENAWKAAARSDHFLQRVPVEDAPPSERTEVYLLYDSDNLYLAVRCHDRDAGEIIITQMERDARLDPDDRIEIVLDTFHDQRFAYFFQINAGGAKGDGLVSPGAFSKEWDGIFKAAASLDEDGWSAEFAIPFKTVSFRPDGSVWGLNFARHIRRRNEVVHWSLPSQDYQLFHLPAAGEIRGLVGMDPGLGLDVKPYLAWTGFHDRSSGRRYTRVEPGFDAFLRLTGGMTASLTVNTDFADTEVDARQVILSRFPLFFPEKRDFFLHDTSIFNFSDFSRSRRDILPFFSRRIGLSSEEGEVPILAGIKVTGREGPFNVGLLDVQTDEKGELDRENLLVARASMNIGEESSAGFIYTRGDPTSDTRNDVLGLDFTYRTSEFLGDKRFRAGGYALKSWTHGVNEDDLAYGAFVDYPNDLFNFRLEAMEIQEAFDPRLGFVPRRGVRKYSEQFSFSPRPNTWIRQLHFRINSDVFTQVGSTVESARIIFTPFHVILDSGDFLWMHIRREFDRPSEAFEIHEGVVLAPDMYYWTRGVINLQTSEHRPVSINLMYSTGDYYSGQLAQYHAGLSVLLDRHVSLSVVGDINDVDLPEGDFITRLCSFRAKINLSSELSWSNLLQYDNISRSLGLNSRLRWNFKPGSDLFLVLNQGWDKEGASLIPAAKEITMKVEYAFRF